MQAAHFLQSCYLRFNQLLTLLTVSKHPPGPTWLEEIEEASRARQTNILDYLTFDSPRLMRKYGGIIRLSKKKYLIAEPEAFKHILKTKVSNFTKKNKTYDRIKLMFGKGLIVNEGIQWEKNRQLMQPVFDRQRLKQYATIMTDYTKTLLDSWEQKPLQPISIAKEIRTLTLKIAFKVFSTYEASPTELNTVIKLFDQGNPHLSFFPYLKPWVPFPSNLLFFYAVRRLNTLLKKIIHQRRQENSDKGDALEILLRANQTQNLALSESALIDEYKTILITGHETTGCGLSWACYLLAKHPEYWDLMATELKTVLEGRTPTLEDCPKLPLTKAIFLEALRLYPSIWVLPRTAVQSDEVCGYTIPARSDLLLNLYALHRNPMHWENPETFYPPRFLGEEQTKRDPFSYLPFSVGPHACLGSNFGIMEGILVLAMIGQRFRLELIKPTKKVKPEPYVSLRLPEKVRMRIGA